MTQHYIAKSAHTKPCAVCRTPIVKGDPASRWMWLNDDDGKFHIQRAHQACGAESERRTCEEWGEGGPFAEEPETLAMLAEKVAAANPGRDAFVPKDPAK